MEAATTEAPPPSGKEASAAARPAPVSTSVIGRLFRDTRDEIANRGSFPPGPVDFSASRTRQMARDPLPIVLAAYERYGPVFSLRILHQQQIWALGPEANHQILVTDARNFHWREGGFGDLIPLLGDGLLTIDGDYHRRARRIMLPAFHREQIAAAAGTMIEEAELALRDWRPGEVVDVYHWARTLAMRVAMRALLGLDPDDGDTGARAAVEFERALSFYGTDFALRFLRGPGSPWSNLHAAREQLDRILFDEIRRRRASGDPGEGDILGMLLAATDEDGSALSDQEVRDQAITLMFAGHDTSTSTISFLLYELARNPHELAALYEEQDRVLGGRPPGIAELTGGLPRLELVLDETLRLYPPAWIGPRRAVEACELAGVRIPAGAYVNYSSWASHRLPEVFPEPEAFVPDRFTPERKAALPKGAYVPFGGGSRTCIGMRFGQLEIRAVVTLLLQRFRLELQPGRTMTVRQMPTLSPRGGLDMVVRERGAAVPVA
ncbi:MAG TPA: cytochrome P450 [Thermoleophilaceae bacterium]|nr:cytochrome P450 [Thermoleophilaceae bacterium]